ncbi:hypothetical protein PTKIN_Ptkin19aG0046900 [Pterospermum kingtungense]
MGRIEEKMKSTQVRQILYQAISLGMIIASALMIWKGLICITGSESPIVVVLSGSMEPGFKRGDILFLYMNKDPIRVGEIVVFNDGRDIPIVHRVVEVHERQDTKEADILTKGDANHMDDRILYSSSQRWLQQKYIMGKAVGCVFTMQVFAISWMGDNYHDREAHYQVHTFKCVGIAGHNLKGVRTSLQYLRHDYETPDFQCGARSRGYVNLQTLRLINIIRSLFLMVLRRVNLEVYEIPSHMERASHFPWQSKKV